MDMVATGAVRRILVDANQHNREHVAGAPSSRPSAAPPPPRASFPKLLPVFILFVLLLCFLSILLLRDLLQFFSLWLRRRRRHRDTNEPASDDAAPDAQALAPRKAAGLDPAVLATFPTAWFEEAAAAASAPECVVCLSEFAAGDAVRLLTICRHAFHMVCIDSWLGAHTTCPVCRCELAPSRAPGHTAFHHQERGADDGRIAIVVDNGAGTALDIEPSGS